MIFQTTLRKKVCALFRQVENPNSMRCECTIILHLLLQNVTFVSKSTEKKYMHKQTACCLLTDEKTPLSADRIKRVQETSRYVLMKIV